MPSDPRHALTDRSINLVTVVVSCRAIHRVKAATLLDSSRGSPRRFRCASIASCHQLGGEIDPEAHAHATKTVLSGRRGIRGRFSPAGVSLMGLPLHRSSSRADRRNLDIASRYEGDRRTLQY